jgi:NitT/TauT family transport system ATP-binding protein
MVSLEGRAPAGLTLEGLGLEYRTPEGSVSAFDDLDAEIREGAITAIVGPSGCGKTSVIRVLAGLRESTRGRVLSSREGGAPPRRAVILQGYGLLPWKTVSANVELPLLLAGKGRRERRERSGCVIEELGLGEFGRFYPSRLSGGMRQRVALARALAQDPELLLMDEPFSSLDALTREAMQDSLVELQRRRGTTILIVTHSIEEAAYLSDRVYVMRNRNPGRIVASIDAPATGARARGGAFRGEPGYLAYMNEIRRALEGGALPEAAP